MNNIFLTLLLLIIVLIAFLTFLYLGTSVRVSDEKVYFGFRTYNKEQVWEYSFHIVCEDYRPLRRVVKRCWRVRVEVYKQKEYIRTHYLNVRNEKAAKKLAAKINKCLKMAVLAEDLKSC